MFIQVPTPSEGAWGAGGGEIENNLEVRETIMLERGKWPEPGGAVAFLFRNSENGMLRDLRHLRSWETEAQRI